VTPASGDSRLACVVTKKQRRSRLAQASAERRNARLAARAARRRRLRMMATALVVVVAVAGLVWWIVTHDEDRDGTAAAGTGSPVLASVPTLNEVSR
jgi:ferric-dicitrate binding protein FerR (iron transport regulator)